jgi:hypothetical protein
MEFAEKGGNVDSTGYEGLTWRDPHLEEPFLHP